MVDIEKLTSEEKLELMHELLNDGEISLYVEAEYQLRVSKAIEELDKAIESYLKEVDKIREDERRNMWTTTQEGWISKGRAEVCARMKAIITEITTKPYMVGDIYVLHESIRARKNKIVDNELSNSVRGRNDGLWHRLLRFEGKCADALENEWLYAFYLGLQCRASLTDEQLKEIRDRESKICQKLFDGTYDAARFWKCILDKVYGKNDDKAEMILNMMPKAGNPRYEQIMDFLKDYISNEEDYLTNEGD